MKNWYTLTLLFLSLALGLAATWPVSLLVGKWMPDDQKAKDSEYVSFGEDGKFHAIITDLSEVDTIRGTYYLKNDTLVMIPVELPDHGELEEVRTRIVFLDGQRLSLVNDDDDTLFMNRRK